jgi:alkanesulfonate monooxygenase SsuD/methylene tetrahydromethanopterin reductase-like flavin-dependent oxidoreductase (luciferase family)
MLELGGATADGVYAVVGVDPEVVAAATHHTDAGAQSAGRKPGDVAIALGLPIFMADTKEEAIESAVNYALSNLASHTRVFSRSMRARVPALSNVAKASDLTTAQARQLVQAMVVAGTPHEAVSEVALLPERIGRDHFICRIEFVGRDPIHALGRFAEAVRDLGLQGLLRRDD